MEINFEHIIENLEKDLEKNKDLIILNGRSVVACALISKRGKIYKGLNVAWWHSNCAEVVALGNALMAGEREFEFVISLKLNKRNYKYELLTPCGICREMFKEFKQENLKVVLKKQNGEFKFVTIKKLLPI